MRAALVTLMLLRAASAQAEEEKPPPTARPLMEAKMIYFNGGRRDDAYARVEAARGLAGDDLEQGLGVAYTEALLRAFDGDFAAAGQVMARYQNRVIAAKEAFLQAIVANTSTWILWGNGDLPGALAMNERLREACESGFMFEEDSHDWLLHYHWDHAYLLLEKALAGGDARARAAGLDAAQRARATYLALAIPDEDTFGIAAIDAYFAVRLGDTRKALAIARSVDWQQRGDVQDLYIWSLAYEPSNAAEAKKIRARIAESRSMMTAAIFRAQARDALAYARRARKAQALERLQEVRKNVRADAGMSAEIDRVIAELGKR